MGYDWLFLVSCWREEASLEATGTWGRVKLGGVNGSGWTGPSHLPCSIWGPVSTTSSSLSVTALFPLDIMSELES